jgi:3-dehydroquinate synthase
VKAGNTPWGAARIFIQPRAASRLGKEFDTAGLPRRAALLYDTNTYHLFSASIQQSLTTQKFSLREFVLPASEQSKSLRVAEKLYRQFSEHGVDRHTSLVAIGGGMVGDVGGFVASTYMRGMPLVHVPTTLLSMCDSAIGGKTAVNLTAGKNRIGSFYPARLTLIDTLFLNTLPLRAIRAGLAEVVKYALIDDASFFNFIETHLDALLRLEPQPLERVIRQSITTKLKFIRGDFFDTLGKRAALNFGHTFAHALETCFNYRTLWHGEAVWLGMACAALLSEQTGRLSAKETTRILTLIRRIGIPKNAMARFLRLDETEILAAMQSDKKKRNGRVRFLVLNGTGHSAFCEETISTATLKTVIRRAKDYLSCT